MEPNPDFQNYVYACFTDIEVDDRLAIRGLDKHGFQIKLFVVGESNASIQASSWCECLDLLREEKTYPTFLKNWDDYKKSIFTGFGSKIPFNEAGQEFDPPIRFPTTQGC